MNGIDIDAKLREIERQLNFVKSMGEEPKCLIVNNYLHNLICYYYKDEFSHYGGKSVNIIESIYSPNVGLYKLFGYKVYTGYLTNCNNDFIIIYDNISEDKYMNFVVKT